MSIVLKTPFITYEAPLSFFLKVYFCESFGHTENNLTDDDLSNRNNVKKKSKETAKNIRQITNGLHDRIKRIITHSKLTLDQKTRMIHYLIGEYAENDEGDTDDKGFTHCVTFLYFNES